LALLDVLIPEPFVERLSPGGLWRRSRNQPTVMLSALGRERYDAAIDAEAEDRPTLRMTVDSGRVTFVGIPNRHDLERLEAALRRRGIVLKDVSWRG
jgi:hypothetical protein